MGARRWLVPLLAALAVLAVVAVAWSVRPGSSGDEVGFAGGSGSGSTGSGSPPYVGASPGSPGPSDSPGGIRPVEPGEGPTGGWDQAGTIAVDSFYRYDETRLALNYSNGVPECYGDAGTPEVRETSDAVVVTIPRTPVKSDGERACIDIALLGSVEVRLAAPLGDRKVLDGSRDRSVVPEAAAPNASDQVQ